MYAGYLVLRTCLDNMHGSGRLLPRSMDGCMGHNVIRSMSMYPDICNLPCLKSVWDSGVIPWEWKSRMHWLPYIPNPKTRNVSNLISDEYSYSIYTVLNLHSVLFCLYVCIHLHSVDVFWLFVLNLIYRWHVFSVVALVGVVWLGVCSLIMRHSFYCVVAVKLSLLVPPIICVWLSDPTHKTILLLIITRTVPSFHQKLSSIQQSHDKIEE